jgi:hypothetical protein
MISPALSNDTRLLAVGMVLLMGGGLACWIGYLRLAHRRAGEATEPAPEIVD